MEVRTRPIQNRRHQESPVDNAGMKGMRCEAHAQAVQTSGFSKLPPPPGNADFFPLPVLQSAALLRVSRRPVDFPLLGKCNPTPKAPVAQSLTIGQPGLLYAQIPRRGTHQQRFIAVSSPPLGQQTRRPPEQTFSVIVRSIPEGFAESGNLHRHRTVGFVFHRRPPTAKA